MDASPPWAPPPPKSDVSPPNFPFVRHCDLAAVQADLRAPVPPPALPLQDPHTYQWEAHQPLDVAQEQALEQQHVEMRGPPPIRVVPPPPPYPPSLSRPDPYAYLWQAQLAFDAEQAQRAHLLLARQAQQGSWSGMVASSSMQSQPHADLLTQAPSPYTWAMEQPPPPPAGRPPVVVPPPPPPPEPLTKSSCAFAAGSVQAMPQSPKAIQACQAMHTPDTMRPRAPQVTQMMQVPQAMQPVEPQPTQPPQAMRAEVPPAEAPKVPQAPTSLAAWQRFKDMDGRLWWWLEGDGEGGERHFFQDGCDSGEQSWHYGIRGLFAVWENVESREFFYERTGSMVKPELQEEGIWL